MVIVGSICRLSFSPFIPRDTDDFTNREEMEGRGNGGMEVKGKGDGGRGIREDHILAPLSIGLPGK